MKKILTLAIALLAMQWAYSQNGGIVYLYGQNNGDTVQMVVTDGLLGLTIICDDAPVNGQYRDNTPYDKYITVKGDCSGQPGTKMSLLFEQFDIDFHDTLYIYDGPDISYPVLIMANNTLNPLQNITIYPSTLNSTGMLTLRLKTNGDGVSGTGFAVSVLCRTECEVVTPVIDSIYYKTSNGVIVDSGYVRWVCQVDTSYNADSTEMYLDSNWFRGVHLCKGQGVIFRGHGDYTNYYGYGAADSWSMFYWNYGNGDTLVNINARNGVLPNGNPVFYRDLDCYDVTLKIVDGRGCRSATLESVRVRIAQNPIKTIFDLDNMCNSDSNIVNIGYDGDNATITLQYISFEQQKSKSIDCKTFIPDGKGYNCPQADEDDAFRATIFFDDFPAGRTVNSASDICSVCINYEHSFMGDYRLTLICPTGKRAILKYGTKCSSAGTGSCDPLTAPGTPGADSIPQTAMGGSGTYTGIPYGGSDDWGHDSQCPGATPAEQHCDSVCNMYGIGYDYCFSRNADYTLVTGRKANVYGAPEEYIASTAAYIDQITDYSFIQVPAPYAQAGYTAPNSSFRTKHPSNHEEKSDYYLPASKFEELIGCPLNGEWSIQVWDFWSADNGWVFNWSMDICGINQGLGCNYQVGIDSVVWKPDSTYGDFETGKWRGVNIYAMDTVRSVVRTPDTAGWFPINVKIYDDFGCIWDTVTHQTSVWMPKPELGPDRLICDIETIVLDGKDAHTEETNQTFRWDPFGQETDTISTRAEMGTSTLYTVEVQNYQEHVTCVARDSVRVNIYPQPTPNFDPGIYPLEGCEPFTIKFENSTVNADSYYWVFGDGDTSTSKSPTHTYGTGQYDFKYYASNQHGCRDSLIYEDLITVYSSPVARFSWEPMTPTVLHPEIALINQTIPQSPDNEYYWEIQYDRDNTVSYHTLRDVNPTFEWYTNGEDISGNYIVRLIAKTENLGPSGYIIECRDTIENSILLVNDFLQFPTAVTPNGDGVNDRFVIKNLVDGMGYPNNSLAIYDRWGKRVFYKENIASDDDFWDPAADNIPAGTYFWRFVGKGFLGDIQRNGAVEVIR